MSTLLPAVRDLLGSPSATPVDLLLHLEALESLLKVPPVGPLPPWSRLRPEGVAMVSEVRERLSLSLSVEPFGLHLSDLPDRAVAVHDVLVLPEGLPLVHRPGRVLNHAEASPAELLRLAVRWWRAPTHLTTSAYPSLLVVLAPVGLGDSLMDLALECGDSVHLLAASTLDVLEVGLGVHDQHGDGPMRELHLALRAGRLL